MWVFFSIKILLRFVQYGTLPQNNYGNKFPRAVFTTHGRETDDII